MMTLSLISRRLLAALSLLVAAAAMPLQAADPDAANDVELTDADERTIAVEAVNWASRAVAQAKAEDAKIAGKLRTATGEAQETLKKQHELYVLAATYYQAFVDLDASRKSVMTALLAVNTTLQEKRSAAEVQRAKALLTEEQAKLQQARESLATHEAAYKAVVGDRFVDPYTAVTVQLARRKAAKK